MSDRAVPYRHQTWVERNDGYEHVDDMGRVIRVRFSRFHGAMVQVSGHTAYLGDPQPLIDYLTTREAAAMMPAMMPAIHRATAAAAEMQRSMERVDEAMQTEPEAPA